MVWINLNLHCTRSLVLDLSFWQIVALFFKKTFCRSKLEINANCTYACLTTEENGSGNQFALNILNRRRNKIYLCQWHSHFPAKYVCAKFSCFTEAFIHLYLKMWFRAENCHCCKEFFIKSQIVVLEKKTFSWPFPNFSIFFILTLKLVWQAPASGRNCMMFQFISISGYKCKHPQIYNFNYTI